MTKELVDAAQSYLSAGLSVIALTGKAPNSFFHPNGKDSAMSGVPESAEDDALIERVFSHPTTSGIGIVLTHNIVVVDIDGATGVEELAGLLQVDTEGMVDWVSKLDTPVAQTARGLHIYYVSPHEHGTVKLGSKLDLKGAGGYVAASPSRHPTGFIYEWGMGRKLVNEESGQLVYLDWLPEQIERWLEVEHRRSENEPRIVATYTPVLERDEDGHLWLRGRRQKKLDGAIDYLREAPEGEGNSRLFNVACIAAKDGYSVGEAYELLLPVVLKEWERPMMALDARRTIRSGFRTASNTDG
jgi:hypothetical protein